MVTIRNISIDDTNIRYIRFGTGLKNLIIIPGLYIFDIMNSKDFIEAAFRSFEDEYTIYLFERRVNIPNNFSILDYADDLYKCINYFSLDNIYLFGASLGGIISEIIGYKYPKNIKKIILAGTTSYVDDNAKEFFNKLIDLATNNKIEDLLNLFLDKLYTKEYANSIRTSILNLKNTITSIELTHFIKTANMLLSIDIREYISNIKPELFIFGAKGDEIFGENAINEILKYIKCDTFIYEGSCHAFYDVESDFRTRLRKELNK